jgi:polyphosphate kinase
LGSDGRYRRRKARGSQPAFSAQQFLMETLGAQSVAHVHNKETDHGTDPVAPRRG